MKAQAPTSLYMSPKTTRSVTGRLKEKKKTYSRFKVEHSINGARGEMTLKPFESKGVSNTRRRTYCQCEPQVFAGLRDDKNPDGREDLVLRPYQSSQSNGLAQR
jgi:hypothetical protein